MRERGLAEFPDASDQARRKALGELGDMVAAGDRAVMLYLIQIASAQRFRLARDIDPAYGGAFDGRGRRGVEALAYRCVISCDGIEVTRAGADGRVERQSLFISPMARGRRTKCGG